MGTEKRFAVGQEKWRERLVRKREQTLQSRLPRFENNRKMWETKEGLISFQISHCLACPMLILLFQMRDCREQVIVVSVVHENFNNTFNSASKYLLHSLYSLAELISRKDCIIPQIKWNSFFWNSVCSIGIEPLSKLDSFSDWTSADVIWLAGRFRPDFLSSFGKGFAVAEEDLADYSL